MTSRRRALVVTIAIALSVLALPSARAVVGGTPVEPGERPFMAALMDGDFQFCGGSVVAPRVVVTAAHCVEDGSAVGLSVSVGSSDYAAGTRIAVTEVIVHPDYPVAESADVAVLRLAADAPVAPIRLATVQDDHLEAPGTSVMVAGWGSQVPVVGMAPPLDRNLYEVELKVVADADPRCATPDPADDICAADFLEDSCQGDSGGPLFADLGPDGEVQIGIVSRGFGCAVPGYAGYYAEINGPRIAAFLTPFLAPSSPSFLD